MDPASADSAGRVLILVVEDDEDIRAVLEMALSEQHDVISAAAGEEALELLRVRTPSVVLLDWTLPDMTGDDFIEEARARPGHSALVPIVVVSGRSDVVARARASGSLVCPKPCGIPELLSAIQRALSEAPRRS